jgi:hypothetical protein
MGSDVAKRLGQLQFSDAGSFAHPAAFIARKSKKSGLGARIEVLIVISIAASRTGGAASMRI